MGDEDCGGVFGEVGEEEVSEKVEESKRLVLGLKHFERVDMECSLD